MAAGRRVWLTFLPVACLATIAGAAWVQEIEIASDPEKDGVKIFTVRFTPGKTILYDKVEFECIYRQEFPWETPRGKKYTKIHEPVTFSYRHADAKFVHDLDFYSSFRIPVSLKRLEEIHGPKVFNKEYPITVDRLRISAHTNGVAAWSIELKPDGKYDVNEALAEPKKAPDAAGTEGADGVDVRSPADRKPSP